MGSKHEPDWILLILVVSYIMLVIGVITVQYLFVEAWVTFMESVN